MRKLLFFISVFCSMAVQLGAQNPGVMEQGNLIIFHAGSLSLPMKELAAEFRKLHPGIKVLLEPAGSVECARKITDLGKPCDIMASSDYQVIDKMLIPKYADWNIKFVSNEMAIVFNDKSRNANQINRSNWYEILLREDVAYGRSDPNADPCGYRSVMTMQLAEKFYKKPGLTSKLTAKDRNYMRPKEVDLVALLESNALDYVFLYKSVAIQHHLRYVELPDEINLRNPSFAKLYNSASVEINGKSPGMKETMKGEPMIYGITLLSKAPNKTAAIEFLTFMLSQDKGMKIMEKHGQPSVIPQQNSNYGKIPDALKPFARP
ncbi:MAG TPA: tungstate ABC transporter substrate-binding protein WtpA [Bacteroidales bacterium]|nr:tungstate ABC transporter substrate-binding protein WtpA [Bacteroidales bacterium]HPS50926.1 tungstate ABC transporter substrate-binding protein WtpA [Bacteroidales bacterium]